MFIRTESASDEDKDKCDEEAFETIAVETAKAFDAGKIIPVAGCEFSPDTVEFWLRGWCQHVSLARAAAAEMPVRTSRCT